MLTTDCSSPEVKSKYFKTDINHDVTAFQGNVSGTILVTEAFANENSILKNTFSVKQKALTLEERRLKKKRMLALSPKKTADKNSYSHLSDCLVQSQISDVLAPAITIIDSNNVENTTQYASEQVDVNK
ncbi:12875_t:CDS:1, partial [Dentiscutata heterogama]